MVLCHYGGILEEEDPLYIRGEKRVFLVGSDVSFNIFESQKRRTSGSGSPLERSFYFLKCEAMSILCTRVFIERFNCHVYLYDLYKVSRICISMKALVKL